MTQSYLDTLDEGLAEKAAEIFEMDLTTDEATAAVKNLETLNNIRVSNYTAQQEAYEAEVKAQQEDAKAEMDKKNMKVTWIENGIVALTGIGSLLISKWILTAERRGDFFSTKALNAVPKIHMPSIKAIFRK